MYRLIDELKARFPGLEIESCASGGARADLGIMERCDRVWTSDSNDAHERERINRCTGLLLPPELLGMHIGSSHDHITGRRLELSMRAGTAIWGHLGIEWDLASASPEELAELASWVAFGKEWRGLLHSGDVVHADSADPAVALEGVVGLDRDRALYKYTLLDHPLIAPVGPLRLPGLDPDRCYRVSVASPDAPAGTERDLPVWCAGAELSGAVLGAVGLIMPPVAVDSVVLIQVEGR